MFCNLKTNFINYKKLTKVLLKFLGSFKNVWKYFEKILKKINEKINIILLTIIENHKRTNFLKVYQICKTT